MKVVSLCSGIGVTDMCFVQAGAQILVASDLQAESLSVYKYNHVFENEALTPSLVIGDLTKKEVQDDIIVKAKAKLDPDEPLDMVTLFLPPGEQVADILAGVNYIANSLQAKIIYIDGLRLNQYLSDGGRGISYSHFENEYLYYTAHHSLVDYGVPNASFRNPVFLLKKRYFSNDVKSIISDIINELPKQKAPTLIELFEPIVSIEATEDDPAIPLHKPPLNLVESESSKELMRKMETLQPDNQLYTEGINSTIDKRLRNSFRATRHPGDRPFPKTVSSRAVAGWEWSIHYEKNRGYTPLEFCFIMTLHHIPYELAPDSKTKKIPLAKIMERIAGCTAPIYLQTIITNILIPLLNLTKEAVQLQDGPVFKFPERYLSMEKNGEVYYLGSQYGFRSSLSQSANIFTIDPATKKNNRAQKFLAYRQYLVREVHDYIAVIRRLKMNTVAQKLVDYFDATNNPRIGTIKKEIRNALAPTEMKFVQLVLNLLYVSSGLTDVNNDDLQAVETFIDSLPKNKTLIRLAKNKHGVIEKFTLEIQRPFSKSSQIPAPPQLMPYSTWKETTCSKQSDVLEERSCITMFNGSSVAEQTLPLAQSSLLQKRLTLTGCCEPVAKRREISETEKAKNQKRGNKLFEYRSYLFSEVRICAEKVKNSQKNALSETVSDGILQLMKPSKLPVQKRTFLNTRTNEHRLAGVLIQLLDLSLTFIPEYKDYIEKTKKLVTSPKGSWSIVKFYQQNITALLQLLDELMNLQPNHTGVSHPLSLMTYVEWKKNLQKDNRENSNTESVTLVMPAQSGGDVSSSMNGDLPSNAEGKRQGHSFLFFQQTILPSEDKNKIVSMNGDEDQDNRSEISP